MERTLVGATLTAALVLGAAGCVTPRVSLAEGPREYVATDYESVLRKWTRTEDLFAVSEARKLPHRDGDVRNRGTSGGRTSSGTCRTTGSRSINERSCSNARSTRHGSATSSSWRFTAASVRYNDLTKPDSAWIVRLIDDTGNETAPEEITAITKPNALERTYFPYITVHRQGFRIRFPRSTADGRPTISPQAKWFGIRFAGAQGNNELIWTIEETGPAEGTNAARSREPRAAANDDGGAVGLSARATRPRRGPPPRDRARACDPRRGGSRRRPSRAT